VATAKPASRTTCSVSASARSRSRARAKPSAARREFEHRRAFREKVKWRTGCEGRINHIKRSYGWDRTELVGIHGARTWCGHGVFAHNLVKIGALNT
jgi:IS5 family transposase